MDAEFQGMIDGSLSVNAQISTYIADIRAIEKEAKEQDEAITGTNAHVSAFINHAGGTQSVANSAFTAPNSQDSAYNASLYSPGEMTSGDDAVMDAILVQVTSLSDVIVINFEQTHEIITFIMEELSKHSPYKSGRYMHSHVLFADGVLLEDLSNLTNWDNTAVADAHEFMFVNTLPYSRKIEAGESAMAPHGVYELVANEAREKYGAMNYVVDFVDYAGVYGVMSEATNASYGRRTKTHLNKAENRFPAIRVTFPNR